MAQHPFLKSIRPVNLLSFGPNTEEIELRPLNILIGPNGSGKSNLIEIVGLLSSLPDKDPWSTVIRTGGAPEWIWKGKTADKNKIPSLTIKAAGEKYPVDEQSANFDTDTWKEKTTFYSIALRERDGAFEVLKERFQELDRWENDKVETGWFERNETVGQIHSKLLQSNSADQFPYLPSNRSVLSMSGVSNLNWYVSRIQKTAEEVERFAFYRDWIFGSGSEVREPQPVGLDSYRLAGNSINLAQVLKAMRDRGDQAVFDRLVEMLRKFYEPVKDVDTELLGTHLRLMVKEEGLSSRTPASRLSDGTLRWLMLLIILLDPTPPPVVCMDEPELGLHPDIIPTLADLLRDASTRTQLILTTHSRTLIECFSDEPESVCVCEKFEGATEIRRLEADRMRVWLEKYSLGQLWSSGEIGGNRW
jgi:predicted ATPase